MIRSSPHNLWPASYAACAHATIGVVLGVVLGWVQAGSRVTRAVGMGCPFMDPPQEERTPTGDLPYEELYRPWSWALSTFCNVFLFASLFLLLYFMAVRSRRAKGQSGPKVSFRTVTVKEEAEVEEEMDEEEKEKTHALVTGGNGCLGRALVKSLLEDGGYHVHSLDLRIPEEDRWDYGVYSYVQADLTCLEDAVLALKGMETVFHAAAVTPRVGLTKEDYYSVNLVGTENVLEACRQCGVRRLVYTSSATVVDKKDGSCSDTTGEGHGNVSDPLFAYAGSKAAAEKVVREANGSSLLTCALRPEFLLGVDSMYVKEMVSASLKYVGDGLQKLSIVPVDAAARAHILADKKLKRDGKDSVVAGRAYFLCREALPVKQLYGLGTGNPTIWGHSPPTSVPAWKATLATHWNELLYRFTGRYLSVSLTYGRPPWTFKRTDELDPGPAHRDLGWEQLPPWQDSVRAVVRQFRKQHQLERKKLK